MSNFSHTHVRPRAREALGLDEIGRLLLPGPLNSISDVPRVMVGQARTISGDPKLATSEEEKMKVVRCGVTVISTPDILERPLMAGVAALQGSGELTGCVLWTSCGKESPNASKMAGLISSTNPATLRTLFSSLGPETLVKCTTRLYARILWTS